MIKRITFLRITMLCTVILGLLFSNTTYAAYNHQLQPPWRSTYKTATFKVQNTFGSTTKSQIVDAMMEWNNVIPKQFLYKSSVETTSTWPADDGVKTITKNYYGVDSFIGNTSVYYSSIDGLAVSADVMVNISHPFANSAQYGKHDVQSVITHELGHVLAVDHTFVATIPMDTMYSDPNTGNPFSLNSTIL
ncbi:MAG: hypothetical protein N4A62_05370 [Marinisporobacter sp.]|jgi:predicted Zn-dependent protease|nr:hypothetical protein [Marinisporobacter sp.]